jgi:hypothetical protein
MIPQVPSFYGSLFQAISRGATGIILNTLRIYFTSIFCIQRMDPSAKQSMIKKIPINPFVLLLSTWRVAKMFTTVGAGGENTLPRHTSCVRVPHS